MGRSVIVVATPYDRAIVPMADPLLRRDNPGWAVARWRPQMSYFLGTKCNRNLVTPLRGTGYDRSNGSWRARHPGAHDTHPNARADTAGARPAADAQRDRDRLCVRGRSLECAAIWRPGETADHRSGRRVESGVFARREVNRLHGSVRRQHRRVRDAVTRRSATAPHVAPGLGRRARLDTRRYEGHVLVHAQQLLAFP